MIIVGNIPGTKMIDSNKNMNDYYRKPRRKDDESSKDDEKEIQRMYLQHVSRLTRKFTQTKPICSSCAHLSLN